MRQAWAWTPLYGVNCHPYFLTDPHYVYTADLLALESVKATPDRPPCRFPPPSPIPLRLAAWEEALYPHPDKQFCRYILRGLQQGFHVGFHQVRSTLKSARRNIPSAYEHPEVVGNYLLAECTAGRVLDLFSSLPPGLHTSRFGVIPKKSQPGKWRLIVDLSSPQGFSINDGISENLCSL